MNLIVFIAVFGLAPGLTAYVKAGRGGLGLLAALWVALLLSYLVVNHFPAMQSPTPGQPESELAKSADQFRHAGLALMTAIFGSAIGEFFVGKSPQWTVGLGAAAIGLMVGAALILFGVIE